MSDHKLTVLIVDDSKLILEIFTAMLSEDEEIEVIGTAENAAEARQKIKDLNPNVITLDIEMPGMDGLSFLEKIMALRPLPVIMCSTLTQKGTDATIKALELGAIDFVGKPFGKEEKDSLPFIKDQLISKIKLAAISKVKSTRAVVNNKQVNPETEAGLITMLKGLTDTIIVIGASTGGIEAIKALLAYFPKDHMPPIVIVQHMPDSFTASFISRLSSILSLKVRETQNNELLVPGTVYIAPGNLHMEVKRNEGKFYASIKDGQLYSGNKPSIDILFKSVAVCGAKKQIGIILTGMGKDGAEGLLQMKHKGAFTIAQSEESCVVYEMPKIAKSLGGVTIEAPIENIGEKIIEYLWNN